MSARSAPSSPSWARYSAAPYRISRRIPHQTSGETLIVRWSGERPVYAGRLNMESVSRSARGAPTSGPTGSAQPEKHVDVRTFGVQCISPNIVGCSQRSRQVVEQKHAKPCLTSPVSVTR
jgi:hypothetical protein